MAKRLFLFLLKHYLFWLALFAFGRLVFLIWNREELSGVGFSETAYAFIKGLYVDTAMACYLLVIPFLSAMIAAIKGWTLPLRVNRAIHTLLYFVFFLITFSELAIYDEWHTKLNFKALWFFRNPSEVFHTASTAQIILPIGLGLALAYLCRRLHKRFIAEEFTDGFRVIQYVSLLLITPSLLFVGIRGGIQTIPIMVSDAYYSQHNVLNLASVNSLFNLSSSISENLKVKAPYAFMPEKDMHEVLNQIYTQDSDTTLHWLNNKRPNIVLVVLEGWSADMLESLNGIEGHSIAPNMDSIAMQGMRFTRCYASGSLSDQGMAAVFSAFPAQPLSSIITQPDKYTKLPCINKKLKAEGYHTSFMFGGQLSYGNIRSYMYFNEFDRILEGENFASDIPQGKLGAHDQYLFERQLEELNKEKQPFFAAMFTLSTHGPYDYPAKIDLHFGDKEADYVNSVHYADSCIGNFIRQAKKQPWFDSTLFIFISDHSHNTPNNYSFNSPAYRRIPFILYGNPLDTNRRGSYFNLPMSQVDLAAILLSEMEIDHSDFKYSQPVLKLNKPHQHRDFNFAYYAFEEGFGYIENNSSVVWSVNGSYEYTYANLDPEGELPKSDSLALIKRGQAIMQSISLDYAGY